MNLQPTMTLRWLLVHRTIDNHHSIDQKLQQWWHNPQVGSNSASGWGGEWRDVPTVIADPVFKGST